MANNGLFGKSSSTGIGVSPSTQCAIPDEYRVPQRQLKLGRPLQNVLHRSKSLTLLGTSLQWLQFLFIETIIFSLYACVGDFTRLVCNRNLFVTELPFPDLSVLFHAC